MRKAAGRTGMFSMALLLAAAAFPSDAPKTVWSRTSFGASDCFHEPSDIDVVDPDTFLTIKTIACDPGARAFGVMDGDRLVYVCEDRKGELALKCVHY